MTARAATLALLLAVPGCAGADVATTRTGDSATERQAGVYEAALRRYLTGPDSSFPGRDWPGIGQRAFILVGCGWLLLAAAETARLTTRGRRTPAPG